MRRRPGQLLVIVALGGLTAAAPAQLVNGDFETPGLAAWTTFNNAIPNVYDAALTPRSGTRVAKVFGSFDGGANYSGLHQSRPAAPGQHWTASAWLRHNTGDALTGTANHVVLKLEFYQVPGGAYGTADQVGEVTATVLDAASPTDVWLAADLDAVAPAGTVEARLAIVFAQPADEGGAVLLDDLTLAADAPTEPGWVETWRDEFDGAALDPAMWRVEDIHLIKNNELQYYAPDEVYLENGDLVLRSRERSYWGFDTNGTWRQFDYTSGLVETRDRYAQQYGKVEVRAKLPGTQGLWPAHWMLAQAGGWPPEIDIMENVGYAPDTVHMSNHWGPLGPNGEPPWEIGRTETGTYVGPDFTADYHTFGIEWLPDRIVYFVDGQPRFAAIDVIPDQPFYLILNTAVGGFWPGAPDATTVFPQYHRIDYVRFYAWNGIGSGLQQITDTSPAAATVDSAIDPGEYIGQAGGVNAGVFDVIGAGSTLHLDATSDGALHVGVRSATPFSNPYGITIYLDTRPGGFVSTVDLVDDADRPRRLASGVGTAGETADLYFAPGFAADYALTLQPGQVRLLELATGSHTLVSGADDGSATDIFGGTAMRYAVAGDDVREVSLRLADLGLTPGDAIRLVATFSHANTAWRADEFFGVASGNLFDGSNPGSGPALLKTDDFILFTTVGAAFCGSACDVPGGDADVDDDCDVDLSDLALVLGMFGTSGVAHADGDTDFDGDVDLSDLANLLSTFGTGCP